MLDAKPLRLRALVGVVMLPALWGGLEASALEPVVNYEPSRPAYDVAFNCGSKGLSEQGLRKVRRDPGAKLECLLRSLREHGSDSSLLVWLPDPAVETSLVGAVNELMKLAASGHKAKPADLAKIYDDYRLDAYWAWWVVYHRESTVFAGLLQQDEYPMGWVRDDDIVRFFVTLRGEPDARRECVRYWVHHGIERRTGVVARLVDMGSEAMEEVYGTARRIRRREDAFPWRIQEDIYSTAVRTLAVAGDRRFLEFIDKPNKGLLTRSTAAYLRRRAQAAQPFARDLKDTVSYFLLERSGALRWDDSGGLRRWGWRSRAWPGTGRAPGREVVSP